MWEHLPRPIIIYLTRQSSLKPKELDPITHAKLDEYYGEVVKAEKEAGLNVYELSNNGLLEDLWKALLDVLHLPYYEVI